MLFATTGLPPAAVEIIILGALELWLVILLSVIYDSTKSGKSNTKK
jgi:hypothetical protein